MKAPTLLNSIPKTAHLLLPNRLNEEEFEFLLKKTAGRCTRVLVAEGYDTEIFSSITEKEGLEVSEFSVEAPQEIELGAEDSEFKDEVILFLPPSVVCRVGGPTDVPAPIMKALCHLGVDVVPIAVHRPKEESLRMENLQDEHQFILWAGEMIPNGRLNVSEIHKEALIAAEKAFSSRRFLNDSLTTYLFRSLYERGEENFVHDGLDDVKLSFRRLLSAALALSDIIIKQTDQRRVGIILPPGKGGLIANLAVLFAGKVPVNLNFTASKAAIESAMEQAGINHYISAKTFMNKVPAFPWPDRGEMTMLDDLTKILKRKCMLWMLKMKLFGPEKVIKSRGLDQHSGNDEAVLLFTSGSSGQPKGVPLSHRNLLANICQFGRRVDCDPKSALLGCLPLFHSFGCTVTTFYPLLEGLNIVTYPSPLETKRLGDLIHEHNVSLLTFTPTFLRGYLRRVKPERLANLQCVVTAAEKLPRNLAENFEKRFGHLPQEGYGLTETAPAAFLNLPNLSGVEDECVIPSSKVGTVGVALSGVAIRITDPESGDELPLSHSGCIWLKGANVFQGYLNNPELNTEILDDGWFNTGDIGHVDEDGFLTLDGRLSRFSKIAGEMVPHEAVEAEINRILELDDEGERKVAIVGVPDEQKGEVLLLLSSLPEYDAGAFINDLKKKLMAADIPALWCPKALVFTQQIPILASGKLDLAQCKKIASEL